MAHAFTIFFVSLSLSPSSFNHNLRNFGYFIISAAYLACRTGICAVLIGSQGEGTQATPQEARTPFSRRMDLTRWGRRFEINIFRRMPLNGPHRHFRQLDWFQSIVRANPGHHHHRLDWIGRTGSCPAHWIHICIPASRARQKRRSGGALEVAQYTPLKLLAEGSSSPDLQENASPAF